MAKKQCEMQSTEKIPWKPISGYPGAYEKVLNHDPVNGSVTRLLRYEPGTLVDEVFIHDFYEEIYVLSGRLTDLSQNLEIRTGHYGYRHPGMKHGPYSCPEGVLTLEIRNYSE